ncbi:catalase [Nannocystis sp. SCPEA4]|uniref:catalase n=1 Tax=Nannocystis sp. SCPEA4 TaxID=2996787 RepID=UPI002271EB3D|nr:catalase [Nannocystis sp. SCPEA4]MCY1055274.1 catalase [Nannocystis sp. SCPEA4]
MATDESNENDAGARGPNNCPTLTTNQGVPVGDDNNSLKAGPRGPTLLEDFIFREKITHFDHERIPERVVHARGEGAHGYFEVTKSLKKYTRAKFLQKVGEKTKVFVRFSTVAGSRGSMDTARDVRGFAVKFYTEEGIFDLVGNNIPVFFIQDAIKFPDVIHAVKPEPHNEIPQAASAHDTFWDFVSLTPESTHMLMWVMSDRAIPRSLRMIEGFGVNTYRFVDAEGKATFVKFHWKPKLGVHSVVWDESQKLGGKNPDYHRLDLWQAIERKQYPEWEFAIQLIEEKDEHKFPFDVLDATKIWPEELVPLERVGRLVLDRNPDNFFAETEQVAFCPSHMVPGIDFSDDPLLQGRLFSYLDTQLSRLGSPNFHELPINRAQSPVDNNQRDAHMRYTIDKSRTSYSPNSLGKGCPFHAGAKGFNTYAEKIDAKKVRERSKSFADHFGQAEMFWRNMSGPEKQHIIDAYSFELGMVETEMVRKRMVDILAQVAMPLAERVAANLGLTIDNPAAAMKRLKAEWDKYGVTFPPGERHDYDGIKAPELSMATTVKDTIETRMVAVLAADGVDGAQLEAMKSALEAGGAVVEIVAPSLAPLKSSDGKSFKPAKTLRTAASVFYDAVYVPGGADSVKALKKEGRAINFINEAFAHYKSIAGVDQGLDFLLATDILPKGSTDADLFKESGVVGSRNGGDVKQVAQKFKAAIAAHRHWDRKNVERVPA